MLLTVGDVQRAQAVIAGADAVLVQLPQPAAAAATVSHVGGRPDPAGLRL